MNNWTWEAIIAVAVAILGLLIGAVKREISLYTKVDKSSSEIKELHHSFDKMESQFQELSRSVSSQQAVIAGIEASLKSIGRQLDRIYRTGIDGD